MNKWINEETEIATPKIQVITKISKWDKYEYAEIKGKKYVHGITTKTDKKLFEFKAIDNMSVLLELLTLEKQLDVKFVNNEKTISQNITDNDINLILNFCKRNGLPRWNELEDLPIENWCINEQNTNITLPLNNILRSVIPFGSENFMHIPSFIRALHWIKADFLRVAAAHNWDDDINIQPFLSNKNKEYLQKIDRKANSFSLNLYLPAQFPFVTYWNNEMGALFMNCENLLHLSTYYICVLRQQETFTSGTIKICQKCGNYFVAKDARLKFCQNPCTRQANYANKIRKRSATLYS